MQENVKRILKNKLNINFVYKEFSMLEVAFLLRVTTNSLFQSINEYVSTTVKYRLSFFKYNIFSYSKTKSRKAQMLIFGIALNMCFK